MGVGVVQMLFLALVVLLPLFGQEASAQSISMSGEYGFATQRFLQFPLNGGLVPCDPGQSARCFRRNDISSGTTMTAPFGAPLRGVGVPGAGARVMPGGLNVGSAFTVPPEAFRQDAQPQVEPILNGPSSLFNGLVQLNTTLSLTMPAAARAIDPPAATRVMQTNGWSAPGNGQAGRIGANTTPISAATQTLHDVTLRYKAGPNAFGGTMAALSDGTAEQYSSREETIGGGVTSFLPWVGRIPIRDETVGNPLTEFGAGWGYTQMAVPIPAGSVRALGGLGFPCTASLPAAPVGCQLITNFSGPTIGTIPGSSTSRWMYAWTTGTVEVVLESTNGGFPFPHTMTAMGYDTTQVTASGGRVRNIGLVAGAYTLRNGPLGARSDVQIIGLDMQFTPEPSATYALVTGLGLLGLLGSVSTRGRF